jgi:hypothetical protein
MHAPSGAGARGEASADGGRQLGSREARLLRDFFRIHAPHAAHTAEGLAAAHRGRAPAELHAVLEEAHGARGHFARVASELRSEFFDAAVALYDPDVVPPVLCARPLDSVHKAQVLLPGGPPATAIVHTGVLHDREATAEDARVKQLLRGRFGPAVGRPAEAPAARGT